jgi:uncharacterized DUF497 family protein
MLSFEWDEANVEHIAFHQVTPTEAEDVLRSPALELEPEMVDGEERLAEVGQTRAGRILKVVVTVRGVNLRVVTAFDAGRSLKQAYLEFLRDLYE